jgi:hypothetical protein
MSTFWSVALLPQSGASSAAEYITSVAGYFDANTIIAFAALVTAAFTGTLYWNARNQLIHGQRVERAYVKLSHPPPGIEPQLGTDLVRLQISVKNFGRTPAQITDIVLNPLVLSGNQPLPREPVYTRRDGGQAQKAFLVANDELFYVRYYQLEAGQMNEVLDLAANLYLIGYVDYIDQFGEHHRGGYARLYGPRIDDRALYKTDEDFAARNNLVFVTQEGYNYDRIRRRWGGASMKPFLAACLAAVVVAAISWIVLNSVQEPVDRAFATSPYTRVGD